MMLIPCPYCGPRNVVEFEYGGDAAARRPRDPGQVSDEAWTNYVYLRENPRGAHDELWQHHAGCRRWIAVRRNTLTHEVIASAAPGELPPR